METYPEKYDVIVVGAGPAGLMAGITACQRGASVLILEKKEAAGKKLLLTGHGRCNITNMRIPDNFREAYYENSRFLTSALRNYEPIDVRNFFKSMNVPTHEEENGRVFPDSEKAQDVRDALVEKFKELGGRLLTKQAVLSFTPADSEERAFRVVTFNKVYFGSAVILCTGGVSFPATGSEGDGYGLAASCAHEVTPLYPALAPLFLTGFTEPDASDKDDCGSEFTLAGVTIPDIGAWIRVDGKESEKVRGELLFTHQGVSGPVAMYLSRYLPNADHLYSNMRIFLVLDHVPGVTMDEVEKRLLAAMQADPNRHMKRLLCETFRLREKMAELVLSEDKAAHDVTKPERRKIVETLKGTRLPIAERTPMDVAYVTRGGVNVKQVDPKTMESKLMKGLYFAGEILDVDGISGGYNLQCAWSTGFTAGLYAASSVTQEEEH